MSIFCYKNIDTSKHLGKELKEAREKKQITLEEVAKKTRIPIKYLEAIENNRFFDLPKAHSHRCAYLRALCDLYNLDGENILYKFRCENGLENLSVPNLKTTDTKNLHTVPILIRNFFLISFIFLFIVYLGWQIHGIITPPKLILYSPTEGQISTRAEIVVQGETNKENKLEVNGREIKVDEEGKFNTTILLSNGVNTITLSATKKHGKTTTVTRHMVVNLKNNDGSNMDTNLRIEALEQ